METHPVLGEVIVRKRRNWPPRCPVCATTMSAGTARATRTVWQAKTSLDMARFLAVADTFDAMTSDRPYRKGLPMETALIEIHKSAGTQFDPVMAYAFVAMMRQTRGIDQQVQMDKAA